MRPGPHALLALVHRGPDRVVQHLVLTAAVVVVLAACYAAMWRGWRRRRARDRGLPALPTPPAALGRRLLPPVRGLWLGTTTPDGWLDRVVVHGLSDRGRVLLSVHDDGLLVQPASARDWWVPAGSLRAARADRAHAGKVTGDDRLLVLTVEHAGVLLDCGVRPDDPAVLPATLAALSYLVAGSPTASPVGPDGPPGSGQPAPPGAPGAAPPDTASDSAPKASTPPPAAQPAAAVSGPDPAAQAEAAGSGARGAAVGGPLAARLPPPIVPGADPALPSPTTDATASAAAAAAAAAAVAASAAPLPSPSLAPALDPLTAPLPLLTAITRWETRVPMTVPAGHGPAAVPPSSAGPGHPVPLGDRAEQPAAPATRAPRPAGPPPALLVLEDGRTFRGRSYGTVGRTVGEAVFSTGMTGYQETLTDPSYHRQVVVMTAPHIGNTGVNDDDPESSRIWVAGFVVRDPAPRPSSWRSQRSLDDELRRYGVVGISGIDTRALTRHLRERGAMRVGIDSTGADPETLLGAVRDSPSMLGARLAPEVSTPQPYTVDAVGERRFTVAALDLGLKRATTGYFARAGVRTHVLPATASAADLLADRPDGVFVSNGPGDPATADDAVAALRGVLEAGVPVFGICFGNQVLGRALGLGTYKLGYGHRGINQPVQDRRTGRVAVTSHNHGFAVDADPAQALDTPYGPVEVSHLALNDGVVEGLRCTAVPAFSVQYHPEAAPGPHDATDLFTQFTALMAARGRP